MNKAIWSVEATELEKLYKTLNDNLPSLSKEVEPLIKINDANVVLLYARRSLEVIVTELCENELKRPRKTEPLKGIIDKLNSEDKVPSYIITSMHSLNSLATFGTHPKDFDPEQVKPVLINLSVVIKWYLKFKGIEIPVLAAAEPIRKDEAKDDDLEKAIRDGTLRPGKGSRSIAAAGKSHWKKTILPLAGLGVLLLTTLLIVPPLLKQKISPEATSMNKSIAVLPFDNLSGDDDQEYFSDGMLDEVLDRLFKIGDLKVISRTSSMRYKNSDLSLKEIAGELGVSAILEGSVRRAGNMVRISVQLIDAGTDAHLWSETYDGDMSDLSRIFIIQSEVAQSVARELKAVLSPQGLKLIEKIPTQSMEAYDAYLRGMFYWNKLTQNDLETAMKYFELAKEKDPEYAPAYVGISAVWGGLVQTGVMSPEECGPKIMEALTKAIELDSTNADVIYTQACMNTWMLWDWEAGESAFKKTLEINPNHAEAHAYYSHLLNIIGKPEDAMKEIEIALELDPFNPLLISLYSVDLIFVRRFEEAIKAAKEALRMEPTAPVALSGLEWALHITGRYEEAWEVIKRDYEGVGLGRYFNQDINESGYADALNKAAEAIKILADSTFINPSFLANLYILAGNKEPALECLEKAYEIREPNLPYLRSPLFDIIREEPRFHEIARKMNLPYK